MSDAKSIPIYQQMLDLLADGRMHTREELHQLCLPSGIDTVRQRIFHLKARLPVGEAIRSTRIDGVLYYQLVRLLASAADGRK